MPVNYDKASFMSQLPNLKIIASGSTTFDVSGAYTTNAVFTFVLRSNIDASNQHVLMFGTNNRNDPAIPYTALPTTFESIATVAGLSQSVFTDAYLYIDTSNNLVLEFKNVSFSGTYAVTTPSNIQVTWYVLDMPTAA